MWPESVIQVNQDMIDAFTPGSRLGRRWGPADWILPPRNNVLMMREVAVSRLHGSGIEIGAGANPMPVPLDCQVRYVDVFDANELKQQAYDGQALNDLVVPDIKAKFEDLSPIPEGSIDFVIACHVIEHTRDPIGALAGAWRKLRPGGSIVLVVPEISRTFDRHRALTDLNHLIDDFRTRDEMRLRDVPHFQEFYSKAFPTAAGEFEHTWKSKWSEDFPIHYHTWTHDSFGSMIDWMKQAGELPDLTEVWSQPPIDEAFDCIEFWFVLRKGDAS